MNYKSTWNTIVKYFNSNINEKESAIQKLWEGILSELFGYSRLMGLLVSQKHLVIGSNGSLIPDILLKKDNNIVCAIELKQETITLNKKIEKQLFSYLKQAKLSVGIIIADKIYLYAYEYQKDDNEQLSIEIPFEEDNKDGVKFVEVIHRESFAKESVFDFVRENNLFIQNVNKIRQSLNNEFIKSSVRNSLLSKYKEEEVDEALKIISFDFSNSLLSLHKQHHSKKGPTKKSEPTSLEVTTINSESLDSSKILEGGVPTKNYLKQYLIAKGIINDNRDFNLASLNKNNKFFWANPRVECINNNWCLALNDTPNRTLYIFKIPANSISRKQIITRMHHHKDEAIQITIVKREEMFVCSTCKIDYTNWLFCKINY